MAFPVEDIIQLIPQKPPFVMVGKLLHTDATVARSSFLITEDNVFVRDGYFQEAGLLENMAQTAALGAGYLAQVENRPVVSGYIAAVNNFEVSNLPLVNDELVTEVRIENRIFNVTVISGKVWNKGELIASGEMKLFSVSE
ncbi:MAG TPA: 3-hydroxyacyl-ACP dehydratase [Mucilaginibacter sp.]|nr:3-hydroxyacyl-ACP dehydratase [Mucilaginibacter sp.]